MSFLSPAYLWLLLALPPIAALYLLKVRPERQLTTALFLWDKIFQERKASALFQKLRELISLLIVLLAGLLIVLALARPVLDSGTDKRDILILVDNSASMGAGKRLDDAKAAARNIASNLAGKRKVAVAAVSDRVEMLALSTASAKEALRGIDSIKPSFRPFDSSAIDALISAGGPPEKLRRILISDACFKNAGSFKTAELLKVGSPIENIGICSFEATRIPGAKGNVEIFYQLASSAKKDTQAELTLCHGDASKPVKAISANVSPGVNKGERVSIESGESGRWILILEDKKTTFKADKQAFAWLPPVEPVGVAIDAPETGVFFARCVEAFRESGGLLKQDSDSPDLIVSQGGKAAAAPASNMIIFKPEGSSPFWLSLGKELPSAPATLIAKGHPAAKHAPLDGFIMSGAREIKPPSSSTIVFASPEGVPLLYKCEAGGRSAYVFNCDPMSSGLFQSVAFPVALCSMALDLAKRELSPELQFAPGQSSKPIAAASTLATPSAHDISLPAGARIDFEEPGFYELKSSSGKSQTFACSLHDPQSSLLDNSAVKSSESASKAGSGRPLSEAFLALALLLLALEEILYHRRKAG